MEKGRQADKTVVELDNVDLDQGGGLEGIFDVNAEALDARRAPALSKPGFMPGIGAVVGTLTSFAEQGLPAVDFPQNRTGLPVPARTTLALRTEDIGCQVVLVLEEGDVRKPIILGCLRPSSGRQPPTEPPAKPVEVKLDGEEVVLSAEKEIVLRCGKASITLTRAGKVLIRGAFLLSRSSGVNRIKGGSVQIN